MDMQKQAMKYWQLLQQGYSPADAYAQAFPDGIPTEQERLEDAAKEEQKAGLAQAGGVLAGALGARELARAVAGESSILDTVGGWLSSKGATEAGGQVAQQAGQQAARQALAAPEMVGAERVIEGAVNAGAPEVATTWFGASPFATAGAIAAGAQMGTQQFEGAKKLLEGKGRVSLQEGVALFPFDGGASLVSAIIGKDISSGKSEDQVRRDAVRSMLQDNGFLDDEYGLTLANGQRADLGLDGGALYTGVGGDEIKYGYETDWKNPLTGESVGRLNALAAALTGGDQKATSDLVSQLNNAVLQGSPDANAAMLNVRGIYDKTGLTKDDLFGRINALEIDDPTKAAYHNAINSVFENRAYGAPGTSDPLAFMQQEASTALSPNLPPTLSEQLGIKGPVANSPSYHQSGSLQNATSQWESLMPESWAGDRRGNIPLPGFTLPHPMTPEEMALQRQFGSQLAAALAGR